jgi:hypothetical protein
MMSTGAGIMSVVAILIVLGFIVSPIGAISMALLFSPVLILALLIMSADRDEE